MRASLSPPSRAAVDPDPLDLAAHLGDRHPDSSPLGWQDRRAARRAPPRLDARSEMAGPMAMPGDAGIGEPAASCRAGTRWRCVLVAPARRSGGRLGLRRGRVPRAPGSRWRSARPDGRQSAPRVATRERLVAGTGPTPVSRLRSSIRASKSLASWTSRAAGRACSPCGLVIFMTAVYAGGGPLGSAARPPSAERSVAAAPLGTGSARCDCFAANDPTASAATSSGAAPPAAATAATTRPSTSGAAHSTARSRTSGSTMSSAISAESTALPRSIRTTTPTPVVCCVDRLDDGGRVGSERRRVEPGGDRDPHLGAVQHLRGERHRRVGQRAAVGDDHQSGHDDTPFERARAAAATSSAVEVAPGS